jgi:hypothetical protein
MILRSPTPATVPPPRNQTSRALKKGWPQTPVMDRSI